MRILPYIMGKLSEVRLPKMWSNRADGKRGRVMTKKMPLISQADILNLIAEYAEKYPTNSCDKYTRSVGRLLREMIIDILQNVSVTAYIEQTQGE